MTFFESLLALLAIAILLLQMSRRLAIPYPTMLAAAGGGLAVIPGAPKIGLDPHTALALFVAPALVDAAFDFPIGAVWRLWRPLVALAVLAVVLSAGAVAWAVSRSPACRSMRRSHWRYGFEIRRSAVTPDGDAAPLEAKRELGLAAARRQRERLEELRGEQRVGADAFLVLQEELDFSEVALSFETERHIEES